MCADSVSFFFFLSKTFLDRYCDDKRGISVLGGAGCVRKYAFVMVNILVFIKADKYILKCDKGT